MARNPAKRQRPRRPAEAVPAAPVEVTVGRLGARGDGIAEAGGAAGGTLFLPLTVPGDRVRARRVARRGEGWSAEVEALLAPGPGRAEPACPHFGTCGGCAVQHLDDALYAAWKTALLLEPLRRAGLEPGEVLPWHRSPPGSRRRVAFAIEGRRVGFNARASHAVVDLEACAVATPRIVAAIPALRGLVPHAADAALLDTGEALDLMVEARSGPDAAMRERVFAWSAAAGVQRVAWKAAGGEPEVLVQHAAPRVDLGGVAVVPPPGGFLQATVPGERALRGFVGEALAGARRVVELFAGCGTLTFAPALAGVRMQAFEGDAAAVAALAAAARAAGLGGKVTAERRDLARRPLAPEEIGRADAVLLDPPRTGAAEQVALLARSAVPRIVYVSCSPATFARDARVLAEAGFRLERLLPVDQFLWSPHLELAALLVR